MKSRIAVLILLLLVAMGGFSGKGSAETYPSRPVSVIVPFPPGGVAELTARPLLAVLERILKQPFVVVNKPGASGTVGTQQASITKPDGYTLLVTVSSRSVFQRSMFSSGGREPISAKISPPSPCSAPTP